MFTFRLLNQDFSGCKILIYFFIKNSLKGIFSDNTQSKKYLSSKIIFFVNWTIKIIYIIQFKSNG